MNICGQSVVIAVPIFIIILKLRLVDSPENEWSIIIGLSCISFSKTKPMMLPVTGTHMKVDNLFRRVPPPTKDDPASGHDDTLVGP
jgi:hypothetical protein